MSDLSEKLGTAKTALIVALGNNAPQYWISMKSYLCNKTNYAEFDKDAKKLLCPADIHLHNEFYRAMTRKIGAVRSPQPPSLISNNPTAVGSSTLRASRKRKRSSRAHNERAVFEPFDLLDYLVPDTLEIIRPPSGYENSLQMIPTQRFCVQELFLPDLGFMLGRFLIGAWEVGLVNVDDAVAEYMCTAVQFLLKNLISTVIMKRKHYKVTGEGSYYYDIGAPIKDPFLRNTVTRQKVDDSPLVLDKEITSPNFMRRTNDEGIFLSACEEVYPQKGNLITLKDLRRAFNDRNMIPSHAIYAVNRERLTQMLH